MPEAPKCVAIKTVWMTCGNKREVQHVSWISPQFTFVCDTHTHTHTHVHVHTLRPFLAIFASCMCSIIFSVILHLPRVLCVKCWNILVSENILCETLLKAENIVLDLSWLPPCSIIISSTVQQSKVMEQFYKLPHKMFSQCHDLYPVRLHRLACLAVICIVSHATLPYGIPKKYHSVTIHKVFLY